MVILRAVQACPLFSAEKCTEMCSSVSQSVLVHQAGVLQPYIQVEVGQLWEHLELNCLFFPGSLYEGIF